ncbi:MAG: 5-formyltetrahydrofolate cyclo-ligase [Candidatus Omnitrophota bacterium]
MINRIKSNIRKRLLKRLRNQKEVERLKRSFQIQKKLFSLPEFIKAKTVMFYLSFNGEVETFRMIEKAISLGKRIAAPVINRRSRKLIPYFIFDSLDDLRVGPYGICEPKHEHMCSVPLKNIDLVVVPAIAFDLNGNRIGRGMGYYDRFLHFLPKRSSSIGIVFKLQILNKIPSLETYDISVGKVIYS